MGRNAQRRRGWVDERPASNAIPTTRFKYVAPLSKAERVKPAPMTSALPEQAELDAFYAGQQPRVSVAVLDRLFDAKPRQPFARLGVRKPKMQREWGEWQKMAAVRG